MQGTYSLNFLKENWLSGIGGFVLFALQHRHGGQGAGGPVESPPDSLQPALAGTLVATGAQTGWASVLAAVMDLARRGALTIQGVDKGGVFKSHEVLISRGPTPVDAAPHERVLLELLFTDNTRVAAKRDVLGTGEDVRVVAPVEAAPGIRGIRSARGAAARR